MNRKSAELGLAEDVEIAASGKIGQVADDGHEGR
jgi:hypothetical protein